MKHTVMAIIIEALKEVYGEDYVELVDGEIFVTDEEANSSCAIRVSEEPA